VSIITTEHRFAGKHQDKSVGVLSCFDRLIFRGYLPLSYAQGMEGFLYQQKVLFKDFKHYAPKISERLKEHVRQRVEAAGAEFRHLPKKERMEQEARRIAAAQNIQEGIVCGFSCLETCSSYRLAYGQGRPRLKKDFRRSTVVYVYLIDAQFGLLHVKLQLWFPLTMQVYVNGHEFVARKLQAAGVNYTLRDNAFTWIENIKAAQAFANRLTKHNWPKLLAKLAQRFNPLLQCELQEQEYYWVTDQAELATDVLFKSPQALASLYPRLLEHATLCFTAEDVLRFLGRKLDPHFTGEVQSHVGQRVEGKRVKHAMRKNRLKMYDKAGSVLRIETVINDPGQFRVRRWKKTKSGTRKLVWQPLCKGVAWLWRYAEVGQAANRRYLDALAVVDDDGAARRLLDRVTRPATGPGRRRRALQPLSPQDQALFLAVMRGGNRLQGFRNRDLAKELYPHGTTDPQERRRRCAHVTRLIGLLRAHRLVAKTPSSRQYKITLVGERVMSSAIYIKHKYLPRELHEAA
jgi:hypothetical protein